MATKKLTALMFVIYSTSLLVGCATTYHRGEGVIIAEKKISEKDYKFHHATKTGAVVGGSIGAVAGGIPGGVVGFVVGALSSYSIPVTIASTLAGSIVGGVVGGVMVGAIGGVAGYAVDTLTPGAGVYEFVIKTSTASKLIVTQYTKPIPLHTHVLILEKNNSIYLKKKDCGFKGVDC